MAEQIDREPAFPTEVGPWGAMIQTGNQQWHAPGMSLRDYFAAKVMPAVIQQCAGDTMHGMEKADYFAGRAYELADAMLKARATGGQQS